ncbi:MAG: hypothetical protein ABSE63_04525 [Thermoguttaceae bacterium]
MRNIFLISIVFFAAPLFAADNKPADNKPADNKTFTEPGKFSIGLPEEGFQWKKLQDIKIGNVTGAMYICASPTGKSMAILTSIQEKFESDKGRKEFCESAYKSLIQSLQSGKGQVIEDTKPKLESKVPDQVNYAFKVHNPDNSEVYCFFTAIFGKNSTQIFIKAPSESEAKDLHNKLVKSFKELE